MNYMMTPPETEFRNVVIACIENRIDRLKKIQQENIERRSWDAVGHGEFAVIELENLIARIERL